MGASVSVPLISQPSQMSSTPADIGPFSVVISICVSWLLSRFLTRGGPDWRRNCPAVAPAAGSWPRTLPSCADAGFPVSLLEHGLQQKQPELQFALIACHTLDEACSQKCLHDQHISYKCNKLYKCIICYIYTVWPKKK